MTDYERDILSILYKARGQPALLTPPSWNLERERYIAYQAARTRLVEHGYISEHVIVYGGKYMLTHAGYDYFLSQQPSVEIWHWEDKLTDAERFGKEVRAWRGERSLRTVTELTGIAINTFARAERGIFDDDTLSQFKALIK